MKLIRPALSLLLFFVVLTGLLFPLAVSGAGQAVFPRQANGSLLMVDGRVVGSELIGQDFSDPRYFHPRPSAGGYDANNSGGTNLGPTSAKLVQNLNDLAARYRAENSLAPNAKLPADAITTSASGLDPDISLANALLQAPRVAQARGLALESVKALIRSQSQDRFAAIYGEPRVNVLRLNLALDRLKAKS